MRMTSILTFACYVLKTHNETRALPHIFTPTPQTILALQILGFKKGSKD